VENTFNNTLSITMGPERKLLRQMPFSDEWYRKVKECAKKSALSRNKPFSLTSLQIKQCFEQYDKKCLYCGITNAECEEIFGIRLTIDRLDSRIGYHYGNIAPACPHCNQVKGDYLSIPEMQIIGKIMNQAIKRRIQEEGKFRDKRGATNYWKELYDSRKR